MILLTPFLPKKACTECSVCCLNGRKSTFMRLFCNILCFPDKRNPLLKPTFVEGHTFGRENIFCKV